MLLPYSHIHWGLDVQAQLLDLYEEICTHSRCDVCIMRLHKATEFWALCSFQIRNQLVWVLSTLQFWRTFGQSLHFYQLTTREASKAVWPFPRFVKWRPCKCQFQTVPEPYPIYTWCVSWPWHGTVAIWCVTLKHTLKTVATRGMVTNSIFLFDWIVSVMIEWSKWPSFKGYDHSGQFHKLSFLGDF